MTDYAINRCSPKNGTFGTLQMLLSQDVDVVFGPVCSTGIYLFITTYVGRPYRLLLYFLLGRPTLGMSKALNAAVIVFHPTLCACLAVCWVGKNNNNSNSNNNQIRLFSNSWRSVYDNFTILLTSHCTVVYTVNNKT